MTGWTENNNNILPLSKISLGLLEDIGYIINDYNLADDYQLPSFPQSKYSRIEHKTSQSFNSVQIMTNPNRYIFNDVSLW